MCEYCDFNKNLEYLADKELSCNIEHDIKDEHIKVYLEEDFDFDYFIHIAGCYLDAFVKIKYCPKCGRKL